MYYKTKVIDIADKYGIWDKFTEYEKEEKHYVEYNSGDGFSVRFEHTEPTDMMWKHMYETIIEYGVRHFKQPLIKKLSPDT